MHRRAEAGLSTIAIVVVGALAGGALGVGAGLATAPDDPPPATRLESVDGTVVATVGAARCPGGAIVVAFHDGDRVLVTARDVDDEWFEVRDPQSLAARVWLPAAVVERDETVDIPEKTCGGRVGATTTSTPDASTTTSSSTSTTRPGATTVPGPTPTTESPLPTVPPATNGPTTAPDNTAPTIAQVAVNPASISEDDDLVCPSQPITTTISANVTDAVGVSSVTVSWSVNSDSGTATVNRSGSTYSAIVGPFDTDTVPFPTASSTLTITMTARDAAGNTRTGTRTVTLSDCTFG